jgi:DNA (cytosine-5)-methyltransferase 1
VSARAYYNEIDPYAAQWLRNLIGKGLIAPGDVDERSIVDVCADDLRGYTQCHFFAGIGGWSLALRLAGWPDDRPVWSGSCPCQPGSVAGRQLGFTDPRHLWPIWRELIAKRRPATVFGEQVAAWAAWIALVRGDLEAMDYAMGCLPIEAASAGGHQLRDRYFFVARSNDAKWRAEESSGHVATGAAAGRNEGDCDVTERRHSGLVRAPGFGWGEGWTEHELRSRGMSAAVASISGSQVIECPDGKWRPLPPPRVRWVGNEIPARVDKLRTFGNAIDPYLAAEFIMAADASQAGEAGGA